MMNVFELTDGIMALPLWPDQVILEVVSYWDMDDVYADGDTDGDIDDDHDDGTDDDNDDEAIRLWWSYWWLLLS